MILTDNEEYFEKLKKLTECDNTEEISECYNYKLSDINAALGLSQFKRLNNFVKKRKEIAKRYNELLKNSSDDFILPEANDSNVFFRYIIKCKNAKSIIRSMKERGVDAERPVFKPLHIYLNLSNDNFSNTMDSYCNCVSLPIYPDMDENQIEEVAGILLNAKNENLDSFEFSSKINLYKS